MPGKEMLFQTNSISTQVYTQLKKDILEGNLQPGERLIVMEIASKFQISQAPVREALERLKQEGLIIGKPNKGSVVAEITSKEIKDIFVLREIIEGFAVRESIPTLQDEDYEYLEGIVKQMEQAIQQNDMYKIIELDMEFHGFFYERCSNQAILELWNHMKTKVMWFMAISNRAHSTERLVIGHINLIHVLKTGDTKKAENAFIEHMKSYKKIHRS